jgi:hypothetical protein
MKPLLDAFWRAVAYCLHPRVILWSLLPLAVVGGAVGVLGWAYWEGTVAAVRSTLEHWALVGAMLQWLESVGLVQLRTLLAPMIVVALSVPVVVVSTLLLVALLVTPAVVRMVELRRFPQLQRRGGGNWWQGLLWSLVCTLAAVVAMGFSVPLWFVPLLVMILPPLIWGWLTYRVLAFDVLALHASADERRWILRHRRWPLLFMGVVCGYLGSLPSLLWAASAAALIFAPLLVIVSVWLYTLVFAFAACWFAHYALAELERLRGQAASPGGLGQPAATTRSTAGPSTSEAIP